MRQRMQCHSLPREQIVQITGLQRGMCREDAKHESETETRLFT